MFKYIMFLKKVKITYDLKETEYNFRSVKVKLYQI